MTHGNLKKRRASEELSHPNPREGLAHELANLKRQNEEQKGITENLNEEVTKSVRTYEAIVSDNRRKTNFRTPR